MIIDCIGCLHGNRPHLKGGDLLIVTGDLTARDKLHEYENFYFWLKQQKYRKKILIAGNHDNCLKEYRATSPGYECGELEYLEDSGTEFDGLKIWGSPWTSRFKGINPKCCAFTGANDKEIAPKFEMIPDDIDILITHGPSFGNLDITSTEESVGSLSLWFRCLKIRPKIHVFSHIHESYGSVIHENGILLVNCSIVNGNYRPVNEPIRVVL